jgi:hypothetical protein
MWSSNLFYKNNWKILESKMSLPLIQINGKCEVPNQIISKVTSAVFWIIYFIDFL